MHSTDSRPNRHAPRFLHTRYDPEGNRVRRTEIATGHVTEYEWDHRNRLVRVIERDSDTGPATQMVEHTYDYLNRWMTRCVDSDGDGPLGFDDKFFVYDGTASGVVVLDRGAVTFDQIGQIVLQFEDDAQGTPELTNRYLWGPAVDQILADEQITDPELEGDVLWALTDHLGTVRDLAHYDPGTSTTTVANHRVFTSFGQLLSETNAAVDHLFAFTGRALEESTGLQNNLNRWYDAQIGRWLSQDPIGFAAGDPNVYRYVGNSPGHVTDPSGNVGAKRGLKDLFAPIVDWVRDLVPAGKVFINSQTPGMRRPLPKDWKHVTTSTELSNEIARRALKGEKLYQLVIKGHGTDYGVCDDRHMSYIHVDGVTDTVSIEVRPNVFHDITRLLRACTDKNTSISLKGCNTADAAEDLARILGNGARVSGSPTPTVNIPGTTGYIGPWRTYSFREEPNPD